LFQAEQQTIAGDHYTYQRLLNETLILNQRYLRRARMLTEIGQDKNIDAEQRILAHQSAADLERACHDMYYFSPSYLIHNKLIPKPPTTIGKDKLALSENPGNPDDKDEYHDQKVRAPWEYRLRNIKRQEQEQQENNLVNKE
jgi:hypothetical protein